MKTYIKPETACIEMDCTCMIAVSISNTPAKSDACANRFTGYFDEEDIEQ